MTTLHYYIDPSGGSNISGDGTKGNPWATLQHAFDNAATFSTAAPSQFNLKGVEVLATPIDLTTFLGGSSGSAASPTVIRGYSIDENDGGIGEINSNGNHTFALVTYSHVTLIDLKIHNSGTNPLVQFNSGLKIINCELYNSQATTPIRCGSALAMVGCYIHTDDIANNSGSTVLTGSSAIISDCFFDSSRQIIIDLQANSAAARNVIKSTSTSSIARGLRIAGSSSFVSFNSVYSTVGGFDGITYIHTGASGSFTANNIIQGFAKAIANGVSTAFAAYIVGNRFWDCAEGYSGVVSPFLYDNEFLIAAPFIDPANNNFRVTEELKAKAYPMNVGGSFITSSPSFLDIGACQRIESSGGGGSGSVFHPLQNSLHPLG